MRTILPPNECQAVFSVLLRDVLPSFVVWNAGGGRRWAAAAEDLQKFIAQNCAQNPDFLLQAYFSQTSEQQSS